DTMNSIIQQIMVHANNTNRSTDELLQLLNTSLIKDISIPTAAAVNDVLLIVNELLVIQNRSSLFNSAIQLVSCKDIKATHPNSPSGYYYINSRNTYCNMEELCGQEGGWTRIAYLDMTDSSQNCSSGLEELMIGGIRLCRREGDSAGCRSNAFQTNGISYSQICGKVVGYQKGTTDGVNTNNNDINGVYIDGNKIDYLIEQINEHNVNSNFSLIQDTMNSIIQQIMVHANNTNRSTDELLQLLNTSLIKDISIPTAAAVNDVLLIVKELLVIQNGSSTQTVSCKDIRAAHPNSPSGYYHVNSRNTYCNMGELCGQDGGWTRIAYLDMTMNCPSGLQELMAGGIRLCRRGGNSAGCRSNVFQTNGISYSQICGKVVGYQKGTTNAVHANINDINDAYIDGVSITRGSPRQHVWSYIAGYRSNINRAFTCPCNTGATSTVPSFVGENYYCESGTNSEPSLTKVYTADPLWDGNNCPSVEAPCCNGTGLPWFFRDYGNATITDYTELRVCGNSRYADEDTPV
uniref:Fibrinogen C-terminal domain-containing protein n=1 Tax=Amphimedon queenslandica TaxID=400682 RepID=A0A1X7URJ5_AMPQE